MKYIAKIEIIQYREIIFDCDQPDQDSVEIEAINAAEKIYRELDNVYIKDVRPYNHKI